MKAFFLIITLLVTVISNDYKVSIQEFQKDMNESFKNADTSPLSPEDLVTFMELDFYGIDENYNIKAELIINKTPKEFGMKTTTDRRPTYIKYGVAKFKLNGENIAINIYTS